MAKKCCSNSPNEIDLNIVKCEPEIINEIENNITNEIEVICDSDIQICGDFIFYDGDKFLNACNINYTEQIGKSDKYRIYFNNTVGLEVLKPIYDQIIAKLTIK